MSRSERVKIYSTGLMTASGSAITSTTNKAGITEPINGQLLGIYVALGTATSTTVTVTVGNVQVFSLASITSSTYYPIRGAAINASGTGITNEGQTMPVVGVPSVACSVVVAATGTLTVYLYYV